MRLRVHDAIDMPTDFRTMNRDIRPTGARRRGDDAVDLPDDQVWNIMVVDHVEVEGAGTRNDGASDFLAQTVVDRADAPGDDGLRVEPTPP